MRRSHWILFIVLLILPIAINYYFALEIVMLFGQYFPYYQPWRLTAFFKDFSSLEGAIFLILGVFIYGATLYRTWVSNHSGTARLTEYLSLHKLKEGNLPTGMTVGLTLIIFGIIYILIAILFPGYQETVL